MFLLGLNIVACKPSNYEKLHMGEEVECKVENDDFVAVLDPSITENQTEFLFDKLSISYVVAESLCRENEILNVESVIIHSTLDGFTYTFVANAINGALTRNHITINVIMKDNKIVDVVEI